MNSGFASLNYLKSQLLAEALREDTSYDAQLTQLGRGVAGMFEQFCQRKFTRETGIIETFGADRCQFLLERTPVESLDAIDFKQDEATGWVAQTPINDFIRSLDAKNGVVYFPDQSDVGDYWSQLRFTYTGGYFIDTTTDDISAAVPAGQAELPAELRTAWIQQCQEIWNKTDKTGAGIIAVMQPEKVKVPSLAALKFIPAVEAVLQNFVKFNLT